MIDDDDDVHVTLHVHDCYFNVHYIHDIYFIHFSFMGRAHSFHFEVRSELYLRSFMGLGLLLNTVME